LRTPFGAPSGRPGSAIGFSTGLPSPWLSQPWLDTHFPEHTVNVRLRVLRGISESLEFSPAPTPCGGILARHFETTTGRAADWPKSTSGRSQRALHRL